MTSPRKVNVTIDHLIVDGPLDERALRAAIAAELGGNLAGGPPNGSSRGRHETAAAREVTNQVQRLLPVAQLWGESRWV